MTPTETIRTPEQRGDRILELLKMPSKIKPDVYFKPDDLRKCQYFTAFPSELSESFPGSYIAPETFLKEIGVNEQNRKGDEKKILGFETAESNFNFLYRPESNDKNFGITVWNGAINDHAIEMSRLAAVTPDFLTASFARADYQNALVRTAVTSIRSKLSYNRGNVLRIHDDCLASGDSIAGFLAATLADPDQTRADNIRTYGVELMIDGPATAQGILFLKAFAKANKIKLHIDAGYLAFGLSEGKKVGKMRKNANYITYPKELLGKLDPSIAAKLIGYESKDKNIYVVGDMGNAMLGIDPHTMDAIRTQRPEKYCPWNDQRRDPHGEHPKHQAKLGGGDRIPDIIAEDIYFPNGGYLPAELDRLLGFQFDQANKVFIDAARMWLKSGDYGAAFYLEGDKPKLKKKKVKK